MTFSIVLPSYNCEDTICHAIESILMQSYLDWELLIMDGGSTDSTLQLLSLINDTRIKVFSEPDLGIYDAMNKGIDRASGEWIYFIGADDSLYAQDTLRQVASFIDNTDVISTDLIYGDVVSSHLNKRCKGKWEITDIEFNRCHQSIFYKKWLFTRYGHYDLKYLVLSDFAFNLKVFFNNRVNTLYIPIPIASFSDEGFSSKNVDPVFWHDFSTIVLKTLYLRLHRYQRIEYLRQYLDSHSFSLQKCAYMLKYAFLVFAKKSKFLIHSLIRKKTV